METRVPPEDGAGRPASGGAAEDGIEQRLTAIEARLAALESTLEQAVADGLRSVGDDMRRAVSELGRLLLRDLDRLTKVLAEHRDTIVERLTETEEPPAADPGSLAPDESVAEPERLAGEAGRWKVLPRRRRRRSAPRDGRGRRRRS